jgi:hypothetical protein
MTVRKTTALAAAAFAALAGVPAVAAPVPVLRYTFDDSAATDLVAPAANGTLVPGTTGAGFVTNTPSGTGRAYSTGNGSDGTADAGYISAGDAAKLDALPAVTVTAWINLQANPATTTVVERIVSDGGVASGGFDLSVMGTATALSLITFERGSTGGTSVASASTINASDRWVFVALTYDGSLTTGNVNYYVGSPTAAAAPLGGPLTRNAGPLTANTLAFEVAGTGESSGDRTPRAFIDDVRVYNGVADLAFLEGVRSENVPEPGSAAALAGGLGLAALGRRRRRCRAGTR